MSQIAFIDSGIPDYESLLASVPQEFEVLILDAQHDGLQQMAAALATRHDVSAIHVLSHGSSGAVHLGSTTLTHENMGDYADALRTIGGALTEQGDILLYGCDVAQGETGQAFIQQLGVATGADVAASTDLTGSSALAGNWLLEAKSGPVDIASIYAQSFAAGVLSDPVVTLQNQSNNYDLNESLDAALLSQAAYLDSSDGTALAARLKQLGWSPVKESYLTLGLNAGGGMTRDNGFDIPIKHNTAFAFAATRMENGVKEYALSFSGTNDLGDAQSDGQTYGFSHYYEALQGLFAEVLLQAQADKASGQAVKILITGHSLGGGAAQAAFTDLILPAGRAFWTDPAAPLDGTSRLYSLDSIASHEAAIAALKDNTQIITFGAPSLLIDPNKLDSSEINALTTGLFTGTIIGIVAADVLTKIGEWGVPNALNFTEAQQSIFKARYQQFEHADSTLLPVPRGDDPVAELGPYDLGTLFKIDVSEGLIDNPFNDSTNPTLHDRYEVVGSVPAMHSMSNYVESILRALTASHLMLPENAAKGDSPILPETAYGTAANDLVTGVIDAIGNGGNDILVAVPGSVTMNGGSGADAYVIKDTGITVTLSGPANERADHLYFDGFGSITHQSVI